MRALSFRPPNLGDPKAESSSHAKQRDPFSVYFSMEPSTNSCRKRAIATLDVWFEESIAKKNPRKMDKVVGLANRHEIAVAAQDPQELLRSRLLGKFSEPTGWERSRAPPCPSQMKHRTLAILTEPHMTKGLA